MGSWTNHIPHRAAGRFTRAALNLRAWLAYDTDCPRQRHGIPRCRNRRVQFVSSTRTQSPVPSQLLLGGVNFLLPLF